MARRASAVVLLVLASGFGCGREPLDNFLSDMPDASTTPDSSGAPSGVWTNRTQGTPASGQWWLAVASDASGHHLFATSTTVTPGRFTGGFWTSTNGGKTWTNIGGSDVGLVVSNSTGDVVLGAGGCDATDRLWEVTPLDASWDVSILTPVTGVASAATDATGRHLVAGQVMGDIWTTSSAGTWIDRTASSPAHGQTWISIASNSTGTKLVALTSNDACQGPQGGDIWTSADSGVTWTNRTLTSPAHNAIWRQVASDSSGMNLVAVGSGVWTSTDAGVTWTQQVDPSGNSADFWAAVASDATGKRLITSGAGNVFTSTNGGVTWTNETAGTAADGQSWIGVASDAAGVHLVAVANQGDIWTN